MQRATSAVSNKWISQRVTSDFLQRATSATSYDRILQRVTSGFLQQATSVMSNEWIFATSNEWTLERVASDFTTSEKLRLPQLQIDFNASWKPGLKLWKRKCFNPSLSHLISFKSSDTAQKMKFSIKGFFSTFTADLVTLLKKPLMENFIFCAVRAVPMTRTICRRSYKRINTYIHFLKSTRISGFFIFWNLSCSLQS